MVILPTMSRTDSPNATPDDLDELPQFELDFLLDDLDDPTEVMVAPRRDDQEKTQWITMDIEHAVPLDDLR